MKMSDFLHIRPGVISSHPVIIFSIVGNFLMVLARMIYAGNLMYGFLLWNLFLAAIPLLITKWLIRNHDKPRFIIASALLLWLLFLPNAPYIITDLVHLQERPLVPYWYDMMLVFLSAFNGLAFGFISVSQVEQLFFRRNKEMYLFPFRIATIIAMSYGVYLGRYLRFNSWDALINPVTVMKGIAGSLHSGMAGFVFTFGFVLFMLYSFFTAVLPQRFQAAS